MNLPNLQQGDRIALKGYGDSDRLLEVTEDPKVDEATAEVTIAVREVPTASGA